MVIRVNTLMTIFTSVSWCNFGGAGVATVHVRIVRVIGSDAGIVFLNASVDGLISAGDFSINVSAADFRSVDVLRSLALLVLLILADRVGRVGRGGHRVQGLAGV